MDLSVGVVAILNYKLSKYFYQRLDHSRQITNNSKTSQEQHSIEVHLGQFPTPERHLRAPLGLPFAFSSE